MRYTFTRYIIVALLLIFCMDLSGQVVLSFAPQDTTVNSGDTLSLDLQVADFDSLASFQFSIRYDTNYLDYLKVDGINTDLVGFNQMSIGNPGAPGVPFGVINVLWVDFTLSPNSLPNQTSLVSIHFLTKSCGDHEVIFTGDPNPIEMLMEDPPGSFEFVNIGAVLNNGNYTNFCPVDTCEITSLATDTTEVEVVCLSALPGEGNDSILLKISYSGSDTSAMVMVDTNWVLDATSDDPSTTADGTLVLSGGFECDSWLLSILGDSCNLVSEGTLVCSFCDTSVISSHNEITKNNLPQSVYPNPFDNFATLPFEILETCHLSLRICDVSGKEIRFEQNRWSEGAHQITIKRNWFPQKGLYFLTLYAEDKILHRERLIVME